MPTAKLYTLHTSSFHSGKQKFCEIIFLVHIWCLLCTAYSGETDEHIYTNDTTVLVVHSSILFIHYVIPSISYFSDALSAFFADGSPSSITTRSCMWNISLYAPLPVPLYSSIYYFQIDQSGSCSSTLYTLVSRGHRFLTLLHFPSSFTISVHRVLGLSFGLLLITMYSQTFIIVP